MYTKEWQFAADLRRFSYVGLMSVGPRRQRQQKKK